MTGFLRKLKETAEKGIEKGVELGSKGFDSAKDVAERSLAYRLGANSTEDQSAPKSVGIEEPHASPATIGTNDLQNRSQTDESEPMRILKLRLVKGEISKEEFEEAKKILE